MRLKKNFATVIFAVMVFVMVLPLVSSPKAPIADEYAYSINGSGNVERFSYIAERYGMWIKGSYVKIFSRGSGNGVNGAFLNVEISDADGVTRAFSDWNSSAGIIISQKGSAMEINAESVVLNVKDHTRLILDIKRFNETYPGLRMKIKGTADGLALSDSKLVIVSATLVSGDFRKTFTPKILREDVHYKFEPVVVTTDENGVEKVEFVEGDAVYVKATGLLPNTDYRTWIQPSPVAEGNVLVPHNDPSGVHELVVSDEFGNVSHILIWRNATANDNVTEFCVIFDEVGAGEGIFNFENDGVGNFSVVEMAEPQHKGHIRRHHHSSSPPSQPLSPLVRSCDATRHEKDVFNVSESLYCYVKYLPANTTVRIYVVDKDWRSRAALKDVSGGVEVVRVDDEGSAFAKIWNATLTPGEYSIVVDINDNGEWDDGEPVDDDVYIRDFSIPEFPTIILPLLLIFSLIFTSRRQAQR